MEVNALDARFIGKFQAVVDVTLVAYTSVAAVSYTLDVYITKRCEDSQFWLQPAVGRGCVSLWADFDAWRS